MLTNVNFFAFFLKILAFNQWVEMKQPGLSLIKELVQMYSIKRKEKIKIFEPGFFERVNSISLYCFNNLAEYNFTPLSAVIL